MQPEQILQQFQSLAQHYLKELDQASENPHAKNTLTGRVVYFVGRIPPIKAKVPPSAEGTARPPESKEELAQKMTVLQKQMEEALPDVKAASPHRKVEHPYFGYIHAKEWYHHIVMHMAHHLR